MGKRWDAKCTDCQQAIAYADTIYQADQQRGWPRQLRCTKCEELLRRELKVVSIPDVSLFDERGSRLTRSLPPSPLGKVRFRPSVHKAKVQKATVDPSDYPEMFGVKPEQLAELYSEIARPEVPVVVAVAPTGSGKSTFLPFRLLRAVAANVPEHLFTQFGQIVVTQPRVAPTASISKFVSEGIHGQDRGIGWDIGFRFSGNRACDWRNRMVYVTDGTLINWLANADLDKISLVMIDEAHERSNNIDVILSLLARNLPQFPHLKVIIASATIDEKKFKSFFDDALPGDLQCSIVEFDGKSHAGAGYDRFFRDEILVPSGGGTVEQQPLNYQPDVTSEFNEEVPQRLSEQIMHVLKHMFKVDGYDGVAPDGNPVIASFKAKKKDGTEETVGADIVGFLHGAAAIDECARILKDEVAQFSEMADRVDVLRLYRDVKDKEQGLAINDKKDKSRTRVIISSNMAETSLTIDGIVHVVDSGIIKMTRWHSDTEKESLDPITHSKAGCKQRWGRAGRKNPGQAWCLYTKEQFENDDLFQPDSAPEIERSALDPVILSAKSAGGDNLTDGTFPWIGNPKPSEFDRGMKRLTRIGAVDEDGDLTELGLELRHGGGNSESKKLLQLADRFGCGIEMATVLPLMELGIKKVFLYDREWPEATKAAVDRAKSEMLESCQDDLEFCLKLFTNWKRVQEDPDTIKSVICQSVYWTEFWKPDTSDKSLNSLSQDQRKALQKRLRKTKSVEAFAELRKEFGADSDAVRKWFDRNAREFQRCCIDAWAKSYSIDATAVKDAFAATEELIDQLGASKKEKERRDIDFRSLGRLRTVFAWALRDQAYVRNEDNSSNRSAKYRPLTAGDNVTEEDFQIDKHSTANNHPPESFVCFGRGDVKKTHRGTIVYLPLVVSVPREQLDEVAKLDEFGLGLYLVERQLKPASQIRNDELAIRLLMDQVYPRQSRVRCRVLKKESDCWSVEVISALGFEQGMKKLDIGNTRKLEADERDEPRKRRKKRKSADFMTKRGLGKVTSTTDEEPEHNELLSDHDDTEATEETPVAKSAFVEDEADQLIRQIRGRRFPGWLFLHGGPEPTAGEEMTAFVAGYRRSTKAEETGIILAAVSMTDRYRKFTKQYQPGDVVTVRGNSASCDCGASDSIVVHDDKLSAACQIRISELAMHEVAYIREAMSDGRPFEAEVMATDATEFRIELSALRMLDKLLGQLETKEFPQKVTATVIDTDDPRAFWVRLHAGRKSNLFVVAKIDRHDSNGAAKAPLTKGQEIDVNVLGFQQSWPFTLRHVDKLTTAEEQLLERIGINANMDNGEIQLSTQTRVSYSDYRRACDADVDEQIQRAVELLMRGSSVFDAIYLRKDLDTLFPAGTVVDGKVFNRSPEYALVGLQEGIVGRIDRTEVTWFDESPHMNQFFEKDGEIRVKVLTTDYEQQIVHASLRQLTEDPWKKRIPKQYARGKWVPGTIDGWTPDGRMVFVELEAGLKAAVYEQDIALTRPDDLSELFEKGQKVKVRIVRLDEQRRQIKGALFDMAKHIKQKYQPGKTCTGTVRRTLQHIVFVELEPRIEGKIHISRLASLAGGRRLDSAEEVVSEGHRLKVQVTGFDEERDTVELDVLENTSTGRKRTGPSDHELKTTIPKKYRVGSVHSAIVKSIKGQGVVVDLEDGIDGWMHISKVRPGTFVTNIRDHLREQQSIKVKVIEFEQDRGRINIRLSRC